MCVDMPIEIQNNQHMLLKVVLGVWVFVPIEIQIVAF